MIASLANLVSTDIQNPKTGDVDRCSPLSTGPAENEISPPLLDRRPGDGRLNSPATDDNHRQTRIRARVVGRSTALADAYSPGLRQASGNVYSCGQQPRRDSRKAPLPRHGQKALDCFTNG